MRPYEEALRHLVQVRGVLAHVDRGREAARPQVGLDVEAAVVQLASAEGGLIKGKGEG